MDLLQGTLVFFDRLAVYLGRFKVITIHPADIHPGGQAESADLDILLGLRPLLLIDYDLRIIGQRQRVPPFREMERRASWSASMSSLGSWLPPS